jgi:hypothetical protein
MSQLLLLPTHARFQGFDISDLQLIHNAQSFGEISLPSRAGSKQAGGRAGGRAGERADR